jgi:hypothetical protein
MGFMVPCCHDKQQTLDFVVPHSKNITMQSILLGMPSFPSRHRNSTKLRVLLDKQDVSTNLISTATWDCLWGYFDEDHASLKWIHLENEQNVSRIQFCSIGNCGKNKRVSRYLLIIVGGIAVCLFASFYYVASVIP